MDSRLSPKSGTGSILWSVLAHGALYGALVVALNISFNGTVKAPDYLTLDMQEFDAPPAPEKKEQRVAKSPEPKAPVEKMVKPDNSPKELQDEKSDVAGTQTAKPETNIGSDNNGTAASTPYYRIKPKYPKAAWLAQVEGWVECKFDLNEQGEVENIHSCQGEQRSMFESAAKQALAQFKYKPVTDASGKPVRQNDRTFRFEFNLKDEESGS